MKSGLALFLVIATLTLPCSNAEAARVRVTKTTRRGARVSVTVHTGFPIHRTFPTVVVRPGVVRVAPRVYLAPVVFTGVVLATVPAPSARAWSDSATLEREDGWTDFSLDLDRRGTGLLLEIDRGTAQISFAEIVFENGDTQVVDFNDKVHASGVYSLLDFKDGRKVDHVRILAKSDSETSRISAHLLK